MPASAQIPNSFQLYKRLLRSIRPYMLIFLIGILGTAAASGIDAGLAWMIKPIINDGLVAKNREFIRILPYAIVLIFIVRGVAVFISNYNVSKVGRSVVRDF